jgi:leader peptidase (prepilin peptidase)/N-methyltransferase
MLGRGETSRFGAFLGVGAIAQTGLELTFMAALVRLATIDLERRLLPNRIVYPLAALGILAALVVPGRRLVEHLLAGAGAFLFLFLPALAHPEGMGMGDVKLAGAMGVFLGAAVIPALFVALVSGALAGLAIVVRDGVAARKRALPFGVFLALGGITGAIAGPELVGLYTDAFPVG